MTNIQCLIDRQLGIFSRFNYDNILKRLVVQNEESFYGLQNTNIAASFDHDPPIFACRFSEAPGYEHILALANEDGRVAIQDTSNMKTASMLEGFQCHNNAVFDLAWMPQHMKFVTVSGDHTACLWDVGGGAPRRELQCSQHSRSVKTAVFRRDEPSVFATGARDGHVLLWDVRAAAAAAELRPDGWLAGCHAAAAPASHGKRRDARRAVSITGLVFQDDATLLSCGECDGNIKVWDLRKNYTAHRREPLPRHSIPYCGSSARNGYTNLIVDDARVRLYASCMDDVIYCFNVATYNALPERRYVGHENGTFYIKACLSPDGMYLVSGSSDKSAYVWNVNAAEPVARLAGHRAEVTCAAWSRRGELRLVTCSDDARHCIWRVGREAPPAALAGRAEPAPRAPRPPALDRTPDSLKRRAAAPASRGAKRPRAPDAPAAKSKRCLLDLMNASRDADDAEASIKRLRLDDGGWCAGASPPSARRRRSASAEPDASPTKLRIVSFGTPTKNLPDFVMDGEAPHLRLMSPIKKRDNPPDWLTLMVRERRGKCSDSAQRSAPVAPLSPRENVPTHRNSVSERTPRSGKKSRTLLKYFSIKVKEK